MSNTVEMKYYCPLKVLVYEENEYGDIDESDSYELDGRFADSYEYEIRERLSEYCDDLDMAEYFNADHKNIHKLKEVKWDVESVDGTLYGCITATLTDYFTDEEEETFKDWVSGQNSDGLGEGFEQRAIDISDGEMYVSFWHSDDDYFIDNENEFSGRLGMNMGMGGM